MIPETEHIQEAKSVCPGKPALRLIRIETLRRVHSVGFLAGRLMWYVTIICPFLWSKPILNTFQNVMMVSLGIPVFFDVAVLPVLVIKHLENVQKADAHLATKGRNVTQVCSFTISNT